MNPNQSTDNPQINITDLLESLTVMKSNQAALENQTDFADEINSILLQTAYEQIPAKAADAIPGLDIFEDSDNPGSWFWEWEWGECQDGPHPNELEALIAFTKFSTELAIELSDTDEEG